MTQSNRTWRAVFCRQKTLFCSTKYFPSLSLCLPLLLFPRPLSRLIMPDEELSLCSWQVLGTEGLLVRGRPSGDDRERAGTKRPVRPWGRISVLPSAAWDEVSSGVMWSSRDLQEPEPHLPSRYIWNVATLSVRFMTFMMIDSVCIPRLSVFYREVCPKLMYAECSLRPINTSFYLIAV